MGGYVYAQVIVEGETDIPVVTALMRAAGWKDDQFKVMSANGKGVIDSRIRKYWEAARNNRNYPYVIFRDLDRDGGGCPVTLRSELVERTPGESPNLLIRIVDQCIESWILADREGVAEFCNRSVAGVKPPPSHHKLYLLSLMKDPRLEKLEGAVEEKGRELDFGPRYNTCLQNLMTHHWSIERAATESDSLRRALERLTELHDRLGGGTQ